MSQDRGVQDVMPCKNKNHENMKKKVTQTRRNQKATARSRRTYLLDCRGYNSFGSGGSGKEAKGPISIQSE